MTSSYNIIKKTLDDIEKPYRVPSPKGGTHIPLPKTLEEAMDRVENLWGKQWLERLKHTYYNSPSDNSIILQDHLQNLIAEIQRIDTKENREIISQMRHSTLEPYQQEYIRLKYGFYNDDKYNILPSDATGKAWAYIQLIEILKSRCDQPDFNKNIFQSKQCEEWFDYAILELEIFDINENPRYGSGAKFSALFKTDGVKESIFRYDLKLNLYVNYINERFGLNINPSKMSNHDYWSTKVEQLLKTFKSNMIS